MTRKTKKAKTNLADRIANHPMYSASDLRYLRNKGYTDDETLAFWDRDHGMGHKPVEHRFSYTGTPAELLQQVLKDNISPEAVAAIISCLRISRTNNRAVDTEVHWFAEQLVELLGGPEQQTRLAEELGL